MIRTDRWKYVHHVQFRPELYDLENDPLEQQDLGSDPGHAGVRDGLQQRLFDWLYQRRTRVGVTDDFIREATGSAFQRGYRFGHW